VGSSFFGYFLYLNHPSSEQPSSNQYWRKSNQIYFMYSVTLRAFI
jgi:hypothetical protein